MISRSRLYRALAFAIVSMACGADAFAAAAGAHPKLNLDVPPPPPPPPNVPGYVMAVQIPSIVVIGKRNALDLADKKLQNLKGLLPGLESERRKPDAVERFLQWYAANEDVNNRTEEDKATLLKLMGEGDDRLPREVLLTQP